MWNKYARASDRSANTFESDHGPVLNPLNRFSCCWSRFALKKAQEDAVLRNKATRNGTLSIKVIKATDLMAADNDMTSDPCDTQIWSW